MTAPRFRTSSFCDMGGCVAVAPLPGHRVAVRSTINTAAEPQIFDRHEWDAFIAGVKIGEFDYAVLADGDHLDPTT